MCFRLFCRICAEFPDRVHKSSNLVSKCFLGNEQGFKAETFTRHKNKGHVKDVQDSEKTKISFASICSNGQIYNQLNSNFEMLGVDFGQNNHK